MSVYDQIIDETTVTTLHQWLSMLYLELAQKSQNK